MKYVTSLLLLALILPSLGQVNRKICISIDDLPLVTYRVEVENHEADLTNGILQALRMYEVPAIGFVNAGKLYDYPKVDSGRVALLQRWLEAGLDLGNHTYSHKNYHKVGYEEFTKNILDGEKVVKELVVNAGKEYRFFRHPYLRSGMDAESTEKLKDFLSANGYEEAFVTVDNDDYLFALAFARAYRKGDKKQMKKIGESYVDYMVQKLEYFENASIELFGRNINHTLLIHANYLNAMYLDDLLSEYHEMGYSFISQEEAISDPAYQTPVTKFGDWGISWIHKWGMSQGVSSDFYEEDPPTPAFILDLSR